MNVILRQRQKGDKISLYLDYYHQGKRQYEYLQLYLFPYKEKGKLTKEQRDQSKSTLELAENIRAKRQLEIQSGIYGFEQQGKLKGSFLQYFEQLRATSSNALWTMRKQKYDSTSNSQKLSQHCYFILLEISIFSDMIILHNRQQICLVDVTKK